DQHQLVNSNNSSDRSHQCICAIERAATKMSITDSISSVSDDSLASNQEQCRCEKGDSSTQLDANQRIDCTDRELLQDATASQSEHQEVQHQNGEQQCQPMDSCEAGSGSTESGTDDEQQCGDDKQLESSKDTEVCNGQKEKLRLPD